MIATLTVMPSIDIVYRIEADLPRAGTVVAVCDRRWYAAGKGINVARGVRDLGGEVYAFTLGGGISGRLLADLMGVENIPGEVVDAPFEIRVNATVGATNGEAHLVEPSPTLGPSQTAALKRRVLGDLPKRQILAICGHCPGPHSLSLVRDLLAAAREAGVRAILDTRDKTLLAAVTGGWRPWLLKPNLQELAAVVGRELATAEAVVQAAREVLHESGSQIVLVSLGAEGALLIGSDEALLARAPRVAVLNTVGAGDAMVAAVALFAERSPHELLRASVAAGSANVTTEAPGAVPAGLFAELHAAVRVDNLLG